MALPKFNKPPLVEVVLSIQFKPLEKLNSALLGMLWETYSNEFPVFDSHHPLTNRIERLIDRNPPANPEMIFSNKPSNPRYWFIDQPGNNLIQVQNDRFIRNWRKITDSDVYPHYDDTIREKFVDEYNKFCKYVKQKELGEIEVNQCEVTYINHIEAGVEWDKHNEFSKIFKFLPVCISAKGNIEPENVRYNGKNIIRDSEDNFIGRLHVHVEPVFKKNNDIPLYVFTLSAKGMPKDTKFESSIQFIDFGRKTIVNNFKELTTQNMHKAWGLINE